MLRAIHLPSQWVTGDLSLGMKWPEQEADHFPPPSDSQEDISFSQDVFLHMTYGMS
jgi:hypothetical protein